MLGRQAEEVPWQMGAHAAFENGGAREKLVYFVQLYLVYHSAVGWDAGTHVAL